MPKTLNEIERIGRDGTSQAARRQEALDPGYVSVDEHSVEDLLALASDHGKKLNYYGDDDQPNGDWSAFLGPDLDFADVAAFLESPDKFPDEGPYRRPHFVLFLAFLRLFRHAQRELNQLTGRHLDFYYRQVLRMSRKAAIPDRVHVHFDLAAGVDQVEVPAGSLLSAGPDSLGRERLYATDRDVVVGRAQVAKLRSVHVGLRLTRIADARVRYPNQKVRKMLEIALGDPLPGDSVPPYPPSPRYSGGGDAGDVNFLKDLRGFLETTTDAFYMEYFELRDLMKLKNQRDDAEAEWTEINGYLEKAGKERDELFTLDPLSRDFDSNLAAAIGGAPSFDGLPEVTNVNELYEQRTREDVQTFIRDQLYFKYGEDDKGFRDFVAMMQIKVKIDAEWAEINRLLEAAAGKNPSSTFDPDGSAFDSTDFHANFQSAVGQTGQVLVDYTEEVRLVEEHFFVSVEEFVALVGILEKERDEDSETPTLEEWDRADRILAKAHREKVYAKRRQQLKEIHDPERDEVYDLDGFTAMVGHALGEEAVEAVDRLEPYLAPTSLTFLQAVAAAVKADATAEQDWERVYSVLEIAWRNREGLPEPVAEQRERLTLYPVEDASTVSVELGIEGELTRWRTFGRVPPDSHPEPPPAIGWAVSSPILALAEGERTIYLTLGFPLGTFDGEGLRAFLTTEIPLRFEVSTEKGWVKPEVAVVEDGAGYDPERKTYGDWIGPTETDRDDLEAVRFKLTFHESADAISALPADSGQEASSSPVLRLMLRQLPSTDLEDDPDDFYSQLRQLHLAAVHVAVKVRKMSTFQLQNDETVLDSTKPFEPFGTSPAVGSHLLLGHPELVEKRIDCLRFNVEWMGLPDLATHYKNYPNEPFAFTTKISLVERRVETDLRDNAPLFPSENRIDIPDGLSPEDPPTASLYEGASGVSFGEDLLDWDRYLQWELTPTDFQHQVYPAVASGKAIEMAAAIANGGSGIHAGDYKVNPPYTPKVKSLKVDYRSSTEIVLDGTQEPDPDDRVFHVHPFGTSGVESERPAGSVPFLPRYDDQGELYVGLSGVRAPQTLTVLFQMAEGSADPDLEPAQVRWSHLDGDGWKNLDDGRVISDTTRGLINSGIVEFNLPAAKPSMLLPGDLYWIRAAVARNSTAVCDTIAIHTQAVAATFVDRGNAPDHFSQPLPAGTLSKLAEPIAEIADVRQPYTSQGGRMAEAEDMFATRVSERLRHKQRALSMWDFERLVLERFPEIYKVKCIPARPPRGGSGGETRPDDPGRVVVVVIPDIRNRFPFDPFEPKAPADLLASIEEYLAALTPAAADVEVRNARYVAVKVRFSVRFTAGGNEGYFKLQLNDELNRFLSPWAYEDGTDIAIGGRIYANSIVDFLDRRPYVDYVADVKLFKSDDGENFRLVVPGDQEEGYAVTIDRGDGVLVAAREHQIDLIPEAGYDEELLSGINFMKVELDFIVA